MAGELQTTLISANEIAKSTDLVFDALREYENLNTIIYEALGRCTNDVIFEGLDVHQVGTPSMNVQINAGLGFTISTLKALQAAAVVGPVAVSAAHATLTRIDIVEIQFSATGFNNVQRAFKDPATNFVTYQYVNTQNQYSFTAHVIAGTAGSGVAPNKTAGWTKIAEITVPAVATQILDANIASCTAGYDGEATTLWTAQTAATFKVRSLAKLKGIFRQKHTESGDHGANVIQAAHLATGAAVADIKSDIVLGNSIFAPTTGYTPAVGDVVQMCYDGTIRKAERATTAVLASGSIVGQARMAKLDALHAVCVYAVDLQIIAVMVTYSLKAGVAPTLGTPFNVFLCTTTLAVFDVAAIDATHILVATSVTGGVNYTQGTVRVLVVNVGAGTISAGNTAVCSATSASMSLYPIPTTSNILLMWLESTTVVKASVISGGTTPVFNTAATVTFAGTCGAVSGNVLVRPIPLVVTSDGLFADGLFNAAATPFAPQLAEFYISGTTVTTAGASGLSLLIETSNVISAIAEGPLDRFVVHVMYGLGGTAQAAGLAYFQKQALQTSSNQNGIRNPKPYYGSPLVLRAIDSTNGVFAVIANPINTISGWPMFDLRIIQRKGGVDFDYGDAFNYSISSSTVTPYAGLDFLSSGIIAAVLATSVVSTSVVVGMHRRNSILGIAVDTLGHVQRFGIYNGSGFVAGAKYYADANGNLTTVVSEVQIGMALSTTQIALNIVAGI